MRESLPYGAVAFEELLPVVECRFGNDKDLTDSFYGTDMERMLCQGTKDKEQAVAAVRDDRVRQNSMCTAALTADDPENAETDLLRMSINEFDEGAVVISVNAAPACTSADWASFQSRNEMIQTVIKDVFSGSLFPDKLAIDQVLSYHSSVRRDHAL